MHAAVEATPFPSGAGRRIEFLPAGECGGHALTSCSIVVPTYDTAALLRDCLRALVASIRDCADVEIVVSDDGSTDATPTVIATAISADPRIRAVRSETNRGFAAACNAGAAVAVGRHIIFYNTDLIPHDGWLDALLGYADADPRRALVGTRLLFADGRLQHCGVVICTDGFPRHAYAGLPGDHPVAMRSGPAGVVTAACVLVRAEVFGQLGGFDLRYRNGYEDVDLCLRAGAAGHDVHYCHSSVLTHLTSATRTDRLAEFEASENAFLRRWGRLRPTDLERYAADGMLQVEYGRMFPLRLSVSPELASTDQDGGGAAAVTRDLRDQVHRLRRENVALRMRLQGVVHDRPQP